MDVHQQGMWPRAAGVAIVSWMVAVFGQAAAEFSISADEIVNRSIEYHGGDRFQHSFVDMDLCSKSGCYGIQALVNGGVFDLRVSGEVGAHNRRVRITNDATEVWRDGEMTVVDAVRMQAMRDWVMARVYFAFLPYRLNDDSVVRHDLGIEQWNQRALKKVKVSFAPGSSSGAADEFLYWFDPESGRLEQFAYSYSGKPGGLRFRRAYNYRRIGGILFYDQENWGVEGPDQKVDQISPESVATWERISTVELKNIGVAESGGPQPTRP